MTVTILQGDVREMLATLPDESVHCVVTSPPYWGLRDYGVEGQIGLERSLGEHLATLVAVFRELRACALLHDASEAYLGDVIRPLKRYLTNYREIEDRVMAVICQRFGVDYPMPPEIKAADNNIILDEHYRAMAPGPAWDNPAWEVGRTPLGVTIEFWPPARAQMEFLSEWGRV